MRDCPDKRNIGRGNKILFDPPSSSRQQRRALECAGARLRPQRGEQKTGTRMKDSGSAQADPRPSDAANRLGLNYRDVPPRKVEVPITDIHTHLYPGPHVAVFLEAADAYGIRRIFSMTPLADVPAVRQQCGARVEFIAVPTWKRFARTAEFQQEWIESLAAFRQHGARLCKLWMAPKMRAEHGLTADHEFVRPLIREAFELGYDFMIHVGDPSVWWRAGGPYADTAAFGTKDEQYGQLEWLLERAAPRRVIAAHMGGSIEELERLERLLTTYPHLLLDSSATRWMVREVSRQPAAVRAFLQRWSERVLFGSDLVVSDKYTAFDHYASRYWAHLHLWETACDGESPIEDPDAEQPPRLRGCDLPAEVLRRMYAENVRRLGLVET